MSSAAMSAINSSTQTHSDHFYFFALVRVFENLQNVFVCVSYFDHSISVDSDHLFLVGIPESIITLSVVSNNILLRVMPMVFCILLFF